MLKQRTGNSRKQFIPIILRLKSQITVFILSQKIERRWLQKKTKEVIIDTLEDGDYCKDRMFLVDRNTFMDQMTVLIGGIKKL